MSLFSAARGEGTVGVDESGKGDYFGPLVVAACYVGPEHLAELEGVRDSKTVTDAVALKLSAKITKTCPHHVVSIGPAKYNELYQKFGNLNSLLGWGHARVIENLLGQRPDCPRALSDKFADARVIERALGEKGRAIKMEQRTKAESDLAVGAASILAREKFIDWLDARGKAIGIKLKRGVSADVKKAAADLVRDRGPAYLREVAKVHFRTAHEIAPEAFAAPAPKQPGRKLGTST